MPRLDVLRLFVSIDPPPETAALLLKSLDGLALPAHRVTRAAQVHMTLVFVGDTRRRDVRSVVESVERSCAGLKGFMLSARELVTIPDKGPARLVAATTDSPPTLLEIQRRLATRLAKPKRSGKPEVFTPHITLCRFPEGTPPGAWTGSVEVPAFAIDRVRLVQSVLRPGGAEHVTVAEVELE